MLKITRTTALSRTALRPVFAVYSSQFLILRSLHASARAANDKKSETAAPAPAQAPSAPAPTTKLEPVKAVAPVEKKKSLWEKVKHEAQHYWDGTKLLGLEIKISSKLVLKVAAGYELTRREHKQLQRTTQDIVRLVPFAMFVLIPFAELLLPIALKIFPNLLPSTYESTSDKEKKLGSLRKTRQKVSEILRETVVIKLPSTTTEAEKEDFKEFFKKVRSGVTPPSREQLLRVARLFKDDTVLDNLQRPQLVAISRYINLQPIGTNQLLRFRIRYKLLQIKQDDKAIDWEGVDSLSTAELQSACSSRGIKMVGVSPSKLREDLKIWLDLRLRERIPTTLLILSNAYTYGNINSQQTIYDALQAVLISIPEELYHEAEIDVVEDVTNKQRLNLLKEQEHLIKAETQQEVDRGTVIQVQDKINLDEADAPAEAPSFTPTETSKPDATGTSPPPQKAQEKK